MNDYITKSLIDSLFVEERNNNSDLIRDEHHVKQHHHLLGHTLSDLEVIRQSNFNYDVKLNSNFST